jgi:cytochrome c551/c552
VPRQKKKNPWTTTGEVMIWVLFVALLFPAAFAGWAVGHYTSLGGKPSATIVHTVTAGTTTSAAPTTSAATTTSGGTTSGGTTTSGGGGGGGNAAAGKAVFASNGCASCHTFKPAGATGTVGPNLDTAPAADAKADHNMALAAFVKESIVKPDAYIAKGPYSKGIMPSNFGSSISKSDLNNLVAFIVGGSSS